MDTQGCPPFYALDDLYAVGLDPSQIRCSFSIVAFTVCISIILFIILVVAVLRTLIIFQNRRRKLQQLFSLSSWISMLTLLQSWLCVGLYSSILIIMYVYGTGHNVFIFLLGVGNLLFGIGSDQWMAKLIRLGTRIIAPPNNKRVINAARAASRGSVVKLVDVISEADVVLKAIITLNRVLLLLQFICLCILSMIFINERIWLKIGVGIQAILVLSSLIAALWQYHRCETAIQETQRNVKEDKITTTTSSKWADSVRLKFRLHKLVLASMGIPATLILLLWSIEVIPMNYIMLIVFAAFDAATNGMMVLTFIQHRKMKRGRTMNNTLTNYNSKENQSKENIMAKTTAVAAYQTREGNSSGMG